MTLRQYLILMAVCTLLSWLAWGLILVFTDPVSGGDVGIVFFYASLGLALIGTAAIAGLVLRTRWNKTELVSRLAATSFRQAIWFTFVVIAALALQSFRLLFWWILVIIVAVIIVLEFFFLSLKRRV